MINGWVTCSKIQDVFSLKGANVRDCSPASLHAGGRDGKCGHATPSPRSGSAWPIPRNQCDRMHCNSMVVQQDAGEEENFQFSKVPVLS